METKWEPATPEQYPIVAYLCFWSLLMVFNGKGQATGQYRDYWLRLPYTVDALNRRLENGRDVPYELTTDNKCYTLLETE